MSNSKNITIKNKRSFREGLFGQGFLWLIEVLPHIDTLGIDPKQIKWEIHTNSYGQLFPNFIEDYHNFDNADEVIYLENLRKPENCYVLGDDFQAISRLFKKYFKIPSKFTDYAKKQDLNNYLGFHLRGTDKLTDEKMNTPISIDDQIEVICDYINLHKIQNLFICTDEPQIIDDVKEKLPQINIKHNNKNTTQIYWRNNKETYNNGYDAMIDMTCLSECKTIIKTSSALSSIPIIINSNVEIFRINGSRKSEDIPYWPDAYIHRLGINDHFSSKVKDILEKSFHGDWTLHSDSSWVEKFKNFSYKERY